MNSTEEQFVHSVAIKNDETSAREGGKLDKIIFTLSTGPFVLSISFIVGLKEQNFVCASLLMISWIFLASAIILHIISFFLVIRDSRVMSKKIAETKLKDDIKILNEYITSDAKNVKNIDNINYVSIVLAILGIIFLTLFASLNINNKKSMSSNNDKKHQIQKHAAPANFLPYLEPQKNPHQSDESSEKPSQQENTTDSQENKK